MTRIGAGNTGMGPNQSASSWIVSDKNGQTRVILGEITPPSAGDAFGDYGLEVISSDGSTVIIDGTSNVFKIIAQGSLSLNWSGVAGTLAQTSVTLSGLGTFSGTLPVVFTVLNQTAGASGNTANPDLTVQLTGASAGKINYYARGWWDKTASQLRIWLDLGTVAFDPGAGITVALDYFVMRELTI